MIHRFIPYGLKRFIRLNQRRISDNKGGIRFAQLDDIISDLEVQISLELPSNPNAQKLINLEKAIAQINRVVALPDEVWSYWNIVGRPSRKNGFVPSRSIVKGEVIESVGGGLCQLSGMIYYLSLKAGLEVIERHPHSVDIYTEEDRYTLLGSDATVVYGFKDFRIRNNTNGNIKFQVTIQNESLRVELQSDTPINEERIEFNCTEYKNTTEVHTFQDGNLVDVSSYKTL